MGQISYLTIDQIVTTVGAQVGTAEQAVTAAVNALGPSPSTAEVINVQVAVQKMSSLSEIESNLISSISNTMRTVVGNMK